MKTSYHSLIVTMITVFSSGIEARLGSNVETENNEHIETDINEHLTPQENNRQLDIICNGGNWPDGTLAFRSN